MSGKNLVIELNAKMFSVNQTAGFLNFNTWKTIGGIKLIFCCISIKSIGYVILHEWDQACPGMPKKAVKALRYQKLKDL